MTLANFEKGNAPMGVEKTKSFQGIVYPFQCDAMGHMTIQYYVAAFDQAFWSYIYATGWRPEPDRTQRGFADVRHVTNFHSELASGEPFHVQTTVLRCGTSSLVTFHEMFNSANGARAADLEMTSVHFNLVARKSAPLPESFRMRLSGLIKEQETAREVEHH